MVLGKISCLIPFSNFCAAVILAGFFKIVECHKEISKHTGKSFSEAFILASTNSQYDKDCSWNYDENYNRMFLALLTVTNFSPLRLLTLSFVVTVLSQFIAQCMSVHVALSQGPYSLALRPLALVLGGLCKLVHLHDIHTYIHTKTHSPTNYSICHTVPPTMG